MSAATPASVTASATTLSSNAPASRVRAAPKKSTPITATPIALPTFCIVDSTPEVAPDCSGGAAAMTVVASGVMHQAHAGSDQQQPGGERQHRAADADVGDGQRAACAWPTASTPAPAARTRRP